MTGFGSSPCHPVGECEVINTAQALHLFREYSAVILGLSESVKTFNSP
ncbi:MAG: hypothetical protein JXK93_06545 [Sphaerochaetaceae bacterium]|nr:hypothetical protein [Sphaerochaetaceae bacterium]